MRPPRIIGVLALLVSYVGAQTITTLDAAGATIVEVVTTDPAGDATTRTIQAAATPTPAVPNPAAGGGAGQQGPVAQPAPTVGTPHGPTPYTYTTTDAAGQTTAVADVFTPSFVTAISSQSLKAGTVLNYSSWLQQVGSNTVAPKQTNGVRRSVTGWAGKWRGWVGCGVGVFAGFVGGVMMVVA